MKTVLSSEEKSDAKAFTHHLSQGGPQAKATGSKTLFPQFL